MANFPVSPFRMFGLVDIRIFSNLADKDTEKIAAILNKNQFPNKFRRKSEIQNSLKDAFDKKKANDILEFIGAFINFVLRFTDSYDEVEAIFNDIIKQYSDDKAAQSRANLFFTLLDKNHFEQYYEDKRLQRYFVKASTYYMDLYYSCGLIGRFKKDFIYEDEDIEDYSPELVDTVPIVNLKIKYCSGGDNHNLAFQIEEDELDELIAKLMAAQKDLLKIKKINKDKNNA